MRLSDRLPDVNGTADRQRVGIDACRVPLQDLAGIQSMASRSGRQIKSKGKEWIILSARARNSVGRPLVLPHQPQ
jgi:hypothetical protein